MLARLAVYGKLYGRRLGTAVLPETCRLCGAQIAGAMLCAPCAQSLPANAPACPACALPSPLGLVCPACRERPRAFDAAFAALVLATPVQQGIHALKYHAEFAQAELLGRAFAEHWRARGAAKPALLIPVPLHWRRQWWRGYNQSLQLARVIGRELEIGVDATAARRARPTADQIGQTAAQRRRNLKGAFEASQGITGLHVALIDDVMTTGATLEELARACRDAGALRVEAWAIARQPLSSPRAAAKPVT